MKHGELTVITCGISIVSSAVCICDSCQFHGTATELASHVEQCPYEAMKHYISRTEERFSELIQILQQKDQENKFLKAMLGQLSTKVESLEKTVDGISYYVHLTLHSLVA